MNTLSDAKIVNVLADSGVYQNGEGYERVVLVNKWHPDTERLMAQIEIRVDRNPSISYARGSIWMSQSETWLPLVRIAPNDFWNEMPGYLRWANDTSEAKTWQLGARIMDDLIRLAEQTDLIK